MRRRAYTGKPDSLRGHQLETQLRGVLGPFKPPRRIARYVDGKLLQGWASQHNSNQARKWRTALRLRYQRGPMFLV